MVNDRKNANQTKIRWALRKLWLWSDQRRAALSRGRQARGCYKCEQCGSLVGVGLIVVDHINPAVPVTGWDSWDGYIERLFCSEEGLQVLCDMCHLIKTAAERSARPRKEKKPCKKRASKNSAPKKSSTPTLKKYTKCSPQSGQSTKPSRGKERPEAHGGLSEDTLCYEKQST